MPAAWDTAKEPRKNDLNEWILPTIYYKQWQQSDQFIILEKL